eukprot:CAMPEP_0174314716 /NCGR_PEP_ID=MMETSP0810-20121108/5826_1 /TAXON_ID=73025 ORGANISM="Eutreptiella gymnastica-like, Strain CCMP1594" /NCGR_SAMPLE_ID=MMETSP0810 /ASSEMBLY_ACC=CAM_ASM_000659 /LENGTH=51 /DNA_ID=CAMNT_0015423903 /DNA_START=300 /DNA_END=455 /DNA_ORIENTATION=+
MPSSFRQQLALRGGANRTIGMGKCQFHLWYTSPLQVGYQTAQPRLSSVAGG